MQNALKIGTTSSSKTSCGSPSRGVPGFHQACPGLAPTLERRMCRRAEAVGRSCRAVEPTQGRARDNGFTSPRAVTSGFSPSYSARARRRTSPTEGSSRRVGNSNGRSCGRNASDLLSVPSPDMLAAPNLSLTERGACPDPQVALLNQGSTLVVSSNLSPLS